MTFIQWSKEYSVNHAIIDYDHQMLINIINQLQASIDQKATRQRVGGIIESLVKYIETHFAREEQIMRDCNFDDFEAHVAKHREIEKTVRDIQMMYMKQPQTIKIDEIMNFLRNWLTNHILRSDKQYVPFLATA